MVRPGILRNWFLIRRDLPQTRALTLTALSFLLPILVWCAISYIPWLWHPDVKIELSAEREGVATVFTAGDHVSPDFYPEFVAAVRSENQAVLKARAEGTPETGARRKNQRVIRQLAPVAVSNGWLSYDDTQNDAVIYQLWGDLANSRKESHNPKLTPENLEIIRSNWALLSAASNEFVFRKLPDEPLLKLVPQGRPANPVYLPAPHEVLRAGYRDFTAEVPEGNLTMGQRYQKSLRIIFFGFLWA